MDLKKYERELIEAIGANAYNTMQALSDLEKESLRYSAEMLHSDSGAIDRQAHELLAIVEADRLRSEIGATVNMLRDAEANGNEQEVQHLMEENKLLTTRLAQIKASG